MTGICIMASPCYYLWHEIRILICRRWRIWFRSRRSGAHLRRSSWNRQERSKSIKEALAECATAWRCYYGYRLGWWNWTHRKCWPCLRRIPMSRCLSCRTQGWVGWRTFWTFLWCTRFCDARQSQKNYLGECARTSIKQPRTGFRSRPH